MKSGSRQTTKGFADPVITPGRAAKSRSRNDSAASAAVRSGEARLLERARSGDRRALEQLLERASAPAWRWSRGFCRNEDDAADLVQDVLHALLHACGFDDRDPASHAAMHAEEDRILVACGFGPLFAAGEGCE